MMCEQLDPLYIKNLIFLGLKSFWWKDLINPKDRSRAPAHQGRDLQWWQGNQLSQNANTIILKALTSQPESSSWIRLSNRKIIRDCFHCPCDLDKPDLFHLMQGKKQIQVFEHLGIKWRAIEPPGEFLWFPKPHGGKASELKIRNSILGHCLKTIVYNWSRGNFQQSSQPLVRICNIKSLSYSKNLGKNCLQAPPPGKKLVDIAWIPQAIVGHPPEKFARNWKFTSDPQIIFPNNRLGKISCT